MRLAFSCDRLPAFGCCAKLQIGTCGRAWRPGRLAGGGRGLLGPRGQGSPLARSPQGTAELMVTVGTRGPGTGRIGCWGRGWTETRRSCSGEGLGAAWGLVASHPRPCS